MKQDSAIAFFKRLLGLLLLLSCCFPVFPAWAGSLAVCSFNIQFLGGSKVRDNEGLARMLDKYDLVVVEELEAPPYAGSFPDKTSLVADPEAGQFFDQMQQRHFAYGLSEEDTGPGLKNHLNSSATEWWVVFYRPEKIHPATDLPGGFLSPVHAHNPDFDRVPYAFAFRTTDNALDFVLIPVHLEPGPGLLNKARRKHELASIASWIKAHNQTEKDFIILGDMNIENVNELTNALPPSFTSLNIKCEPTNTNLKSPKPYDQVMFMPAFSGKKFDLHYGFHVEDLIADMRPRWHLIASGKYPGDPPYNHNQFRKYFSDHNPVDFRLNTPAHDND